MRRFFLLVFAAVLAAGLAQAMPETLDYVDRSAPDFIWPATDWDGDGILDRLDRCNNTPKGCMVDSYGCESDFDGDGVCDGVDQCNDTPAGMKVDKHGCAPSQKSKSAAPQATKAPQTPQPAKPATPAEPPDEVHHQLVQKGSIRLENVYFEPGSAKLIPESEEALRKVGRTLEKYPDLRFEIEGHTDSRGSASQNQQLSEQRAHAVREFLIYNFKINPSNYTARGYGETRLENDERSDEERMRNRRVEMRLLNPEALPRGVEVKPEGGR